MLCPSSQLWPIDNNKVCSEDEPTLSKDIRQTETESKYTYRSDVIYIYSCIEMYRIIDNIWTVVHEMFLYIKRVCISMFRICDSNNLISHLW